MDILNIVVTVFDALLIFMFAWVGITTVNEKKTQGASAFLLVIIILNLFSIWG